MKSTILLVDDNKDDVFLMKRAFRQAGISHPMQVLEDGQKAVEYLSGQGAFANRREFPLPSLIMLDMRLPCMPGCEVLKWIRSQPKLACIPTLVLSASVEDRDMQRAYALGANSFLVKPLKIAELTEMMKASVEYWLNHNTVPDQCGILN